MQGIDQGLFRGASLQPRLATHFHDVRPPLLVSTRLGRQGYPNRRSLVSRYVLPLTLVVIACAPRMDVDAERAAIISADSAWLAAAQVRDVEATLAFWTEDARVIAPGQPPYVGRDAIRRMLVEGFATPGFSVSWQTREVVVGPSADFAYSFGTNVFTVPGQVAGSLDTLRGQGVVVWRKDPDGRWRSTVDIWNPVSP